MKYIFIFAANFDYYLWKYFITSYAIASERGNKASQNNKNVQCLISKIVPQCPFQINPYKNQLQNKEYVSIQNTLAWEKKWKEKARLLS